MNFHAQDVELIVHQIGQHPDCIDTAVRTYDSGVSFQFEMVHYSNYVMTHPGRGRKEEKRSEKRWDGVSCCMEILPDSALGV